MIKRGFGSDNHSGAHPRILDAISRANEGHAPSYGTDDLSAKSAAMFKTVFGESAETFFVFNGTAANVLALGACVKPYQAVVAADRSHLINDECGAPEKNIGCKIIGVATTDGKLTPELIKPCLVRRGDQHFSQIQAISITQPTEVGTVYTLDELRALGAFAKREGLLLHVDGARMVNAAVHLGVTLAEMTTDCGVDVVSVGGTKNGLVFGEAVVFLKPALSREFKYARKQLMQLPSKTRFIAAQFLEFLGTDLWHLNAQHANRMAHELHRRLRDIRGIEITQPTQANAVFALIPRSIIAKLRETSFFYVVDEMRFECRLMTSWDTQESDVDEFCSRLRELLLELPVSPRAETRS